MEGSACQNQQNCRKIKYEKTDTASVSLHRLWRIKYGVSRGGFCLSEPAIGTVKNNIKIIAQSIVAPRMPYIHIAYLAATIFVPKISLLLWGILFLLAGSKLCFKLIRKKNKTFNSLYFEKRTSKKRFAIGLCIFALSFILIILAVQFGKHVPQHPDSITFIRLDHSVSNYYRIYLIKKDKNKSVSSLDEFFKSDKIKRLEDGWFHRIALKTFKDVEETRYFLRSSGRDGKFDTDDDVIFHYILSEKRLLEAQKISLSEFLEIERSNKSKT